MSDDDAARLEELRGQHQDAFDAGKPLEALVDGPDHALLARQIAGNLRELTKAATNLADLVNSWQYLAGMCGLFDELDEFERPDSDWRQQIEEALALVEEATA